MKSKKLTQGESKFTDSDLSPLPNSAHSFTEGSDIGPLERKIQGDLKNIQEGKEAYKMVPVELWEEVIVCLTRGLDAAIHMDLPSTKMRIQTAIEKFKNL